MQHVAMRLHHPFRCTAGSGGEQNIRQRLCWDGNAWVAPRGRCHRVHLDQRQVAIQYPVGGLAVLAVDHHRGQTGAFNPLPQAGRRRARIQWHVGLTGLQRTQQPGQHRRIVPQQQSNPLLTVTTDRQQAMRHAIGAPVQFAVTPAMRCGHHGRALVRDGRLAFKPGHDRIVYGRGRKNLPGNLRLQRRCHRRTE